MVIINITSIIMWKGDIAGFLDVKRMTFISKVVIKKIIYNITFIIMFQQRPMTIKKKKNLRSI